MEAELNGLEIRFQERRLRKEETLGFEHEQSFVGLEMENANREAEITQVMISEAVSRIKRLQFSFFFFKEKHECGTKTIHFGLFVHKPSCYLIFLENK